MAKTHVMVHSASQLLEFSEVNGNTYTLYKYMLIVPNETINLVKST